MKPGDLVGICGDFKDHPKKVDLYCKIQKIGGDDVYGCVINGAWNFKMNIKTGDAIVICCGQHEEKHTDWKIVYNSKAVLKFGLNYNEALAFMNNELKKPYLLRLISDSKFKIKAIIQRFKKSCNAFSNAWNADTLNNRKTIIDDDIPF